MTKLAYRLWKENGLWHWEVTAGQQRLARGATLRPVEGRAEAMLFASHPHRIDDIDALERAAVAARRETVHDLCTHSELRADRARVDVASYTHTYSVSEKLLKQAKHAVRDSRALIAQIEKPRAAKVCA